MAIAAIAASSAPVAQAQTVSARAELYSKSVAYVLWSLFPDVVIPGDPEIVERGNVVEIALPEVAADLPPLGQMIIPQLRVQFTEAAGGATAMTGALPAGFRIVGADEATRPLASGAASFTGAVDPATGDVIELRLVSSGLNVAASGMKLATGAIAYDITVARRPDGVTETIRIAAENVALGDERGGQIGALATASLRTERDFADAATAMAARFDRVSGVAGLQPPSRSELAVGGLRLGAAAQPLLAARSLRLTDRVTPGADSQAAIEGRIEAAGVRAAFKDQPVIEFAEGAVGYRFGGVRNELLEALLARLQTDRLRGVESRPTVDALANLFKSGAIELTAAGLRTTGELQSADRLQVELTVSAISPEGIDAQLKAGLRGAAARPSSLLGLYRDVALTAELERLPPRVYNAGVGEESLLDAALPLLIERGTALRIRSLQLGGNGFEVSGSGALAATATPAAPLQGAFSMRISDLDAMLRRQLERPGTDEEKELRKTLFTDLMQGVRRTGRSGAFDFAVGADGWFTANGRRMIYVGAEP